MLPDVRGHSSLLLCAAQKVSVDPGVSAMGKRVPQTACGAVGAGAGKTVRSRAAAKAKTSAKARAAPKRASAPRARAKPRAVSTAKARTKATAKATRASSARCRGRSSQPSLSDSEESTSGSSSSASSSSCSSDPSSTETVLVEQPTVGVAIAEHCGRAFGRELAAQAQAPAAQRLRLRCLTLLTAMRLLTGLSGAGALPHQKCLCVLAIGVLPALAFFASVGLPAKAPNSEARRALSRRFGCPLSWTSILSQMCDASCLPHGLRAAVTLVLQLCKMSCSCFCARLAQHSLRVFYSISSSISAGGFARTEPVCNRLQAARARLAAMSDLVQTRLAQFPFLRFR